MPRIDRAFMDLSRETALINAAEASAKLRKRRIEREEVDAYGPDGSMYIADRANHKIRRSAPNGVISTFAGTGTGGYNSDDIAATAARLNTPYGVDVDSDGNVYIADFDNERVRKVDTNRVITTYAGTGIATIEGDGGPAVDAPRRAVGRPVHR